MALRWSTPSYEGARRVALSGSIEIGAVFPPCGPEPWRWMFFAGGSIARPSGKAKTELAAKNALLSEWSTFLSRAELREAT